MLGGALKECQLVQVSWKNFLSWQWPLMTFYLLFCHWLRTALQFVTTIMGSFSSPGSSISALLLHFETVVFKIFRIAMLKNWFLYNYEATFSSLMFFTMKSTLSDINIALQYFYLFLHLYCRKYYIWLFFSFPLTPSSPPHQYSFGYC